MNTLIAVVVGIVLVAAWFYSSSIRGAYLIESPVVGLLNLNGETSAPLVVEDRAWLQPLFSKIVESSAAPPFCNVLLVYRAISSDGRIGNTSHSLRGLIQQSGAAIVIVASENSSDAYIIASKRPGTGKTNLVMTLRRNGMSFGYFFKRLFLDMKTGTGMPIAWVKLAPQIPGRDHANTPETIFACEAGQIAFK